jgi:hypothetical protein
MSIRAKLRQQTLAYPARVKVGIVWIILLAVPLTIGLMWGTFFDDSAYVTFRFARNLALGRSLMYGMTTAGQTGVGSPLFALALVLPTRFGIPLPQAGLILSTMGWGATAIAIYSIEQTMRRPVAAISSATLVAFNPVIVSRLGTEIPWAVALAWIAIRLAIRKQWNIQTAVVALLLCTHFDLSTLGLAALLFIIQWSESQRVPLRVGLILAIIAFGCGLIAIWQIGVPFPLFHPLEIATEFPISSLLGNDLYGLFLPLIVLGLVAEVRTPSTTRHLQLAILAWAAISILSSGIAAWAVLSVLGLFLTGLGIEWAVRWIKTHDVVRLDRVALAPSLASIIVLPLGIAQASSLVQQYQFRPVIRHQLEQQAGDWLHTHSEPTATVLGPDRVGFLADRSTMAWGETTIGEADGASLFESLSANLPKYCVSFRSFAWDNLVQTGWFQDRYAPLQRFESPYDAALPLIIWGYRSSAFDLNERQPLNVHLPGKVELIGYKTWPDQIQPGDAVYVTLFVQATQPITRSLRTIVRLVTPTEGVGWAQRDEIIPRGFPVSWWRVGQVIAERYVLTTTSEIPTGAYQLDVSVVTPDAANVLPIFQDDEPTPFDQVTLGYVVVPTSGKPDIAKPLEAEFEDQINLLGYDAVDSLSPGAELDVTLYWEAQQPPKDNYMVFVHLLDADGRLVANHDGPPVDGRYPTRAWLPGQVVSDTHRIVLKPDVPVGTYRLQVGMYRWPSLERLRVWNDQGAEQADRVLILQSIQVQSSNP